MVVRDAEPGGPLLRSQLAGQVWSQRADVLNAVQRGLIQLQAQQPGDFRYRVAGPLPRGRDLRQYLRRTGMVGRDRADRFECGGAVGETPLGEPGPRQGQVEFDVFASDGGVMGALPQGLLGAPQRLLRLSRGDERTQFPA